MFGLRGRSVPTSIQGLTGFGNWVLRRLWGVGSAPAGLYTVRGETEFFRSGRGDWARRTVRLAEAYPFREKTRSLKHVAVGA